jgi:hypothetical protein
MIGQPSSHDSKHRHDPLPADSSSSHPSKKGVAKFFKSLFSMCKHTYDVSHKSLTLSQETRRFVVDDCLGRGVPPPPDHPAMTPLAYFHYNMPPLDDDMFLSMGAFAGLAMMKMKLKMVVMATMTMTTSTSDPCFISIAYPFSLFGVSMPMGENHVEFY